MKLRPHRGAFDTQHMRAVLERLIDYLDEFNEMGENGDSDDIIGVAADAFDVIARFRMEFGRDQNQTYQTEDSPF